MIMLGHHRIQGHYEGIRVLGESCREGYDRRRLGSHDQENSAAVDWQRDVITTGSDNSVSMPSILPNGKNLLSRVPEMDSLAPHAPTENSAPPTVPGLLNTFPEPTTYLACHLPGSEQPDYHCCDTHYL